MSLARAFARHNNGIDPARLPAAVAGKARTCLIDYVSSVIGGQDFAMSQHALALAAAEPGACSVPGTAVSTSMHQAAFTGAVLCGATSQIDTHPESASHPGSAIWPALASLAEAEDCDGGDLLAGAIAGYEVACRLGRAIFGGGGQFAVRPTGLLGAPAAAAACARLLRLDDDQATAAICIAANTAAGLMEWARAGTTEHMFQAAFAARNGMTAALLARAGSRATESTLEGPKGLIATFRDASRAGLAADGLGSGFEIMTIQHKQTPACLFVQTPCQAALALSADPAYAPGRVRAVRVHVCQPAIAYPGCDNPGHIGDIQAARLSIQFSVAAVLAHKRIAVANWRDHGDAAVAALSKKVTLIEDAGFTQRFPAMQGSRIEVELDDGRVLAVEQDDLRALGAADLSGRLLAYATSRIGAAAAARLVTLAEATGPGSRVRELMQASRLPVGGTA